MFMSERETVDTDTDLGSPEPPSDYHRARQPLAEQGSSGDQGQQETEQRRGQQSGPRVGASGQRGGR